MTGPVVRRSAIALAATALIAVSACGSGSESSDEEAPSTDGPVTIEYVHRLPDGEGMTPVADIVARWNADHPDIQVNATKWDGAAADLSAKLEADVKAGTAPCLAQVGYGEVPSLYVKGLFADVTDQAASYADEFSAGTVSLMTVGGVSVGLPQDTGPLVYYYNKRAFKRLGLVVPTNLDDLRAAATKAAARGKYVAAFTPDEAQYWLSAQAAAAGATWFSAENDAWNIDTTSGGSAVVADLWQGLIDDKSVLVTPRWTDGFTKALNDQTLIGHIGAAWEAPLLAGDMGESANAGKWAVAQLPSFGDQQMSGPDGGSGVAVMEGCSSSDQAMEFAAWFNTQIDDLVSQGLVVAAKGEMTTPDNVAKFYGGQDVMAELAKANTSLNPDFPYIPTFSAIGTAMATAADNAGSGKGSVADIFTAAQEESVKTLKDAGLSVAQ